MSKLWDALKKAEGEQKGGIVTPYEDQFEASPEQSTGDFTADIPGPIAEEFRRLLSALRGIGKENKREIVSVLVTSAHRGEGCSTVAVTLAASMACDRRDMRVLLIDANLRNPAVHTWFDLAPAPGLVEAMRDEDNRYQYVRSSPLRGVPNFHLLTAGGSAIADARHVAVIESPVLATFAREMREHYDLVVIDAPPVIPYSDALTLCRLVDATILVIDAQNTRWEVAQRARNQLAHAEANLAGVVLNKRKLHIPKSVYRRL